VRLSTAGRLSLCTAKMRVASLLQLPDPAILMTTYALD
jgi:hypothetical protein